MILKITSPTVGIHLVNFYKSRRLLTVFFVLFTMTGVSAAHAQSYYIINVNSGKCLDDAGPSRQVVQWTCHGGSN